MYSCYNTWRSTFCGINLYCLYFSLLFSEDNEFISQWISQDNKLISIFFEINSFAKENHHESGSLSQGNHKKMENSLISRK